MGIVWKYLGRIRRGVERVVMSRDRLPGGPINTEGIKSTESMILHELETTRILIVNDSKSRGIISHFLARFPRTRYAVEVADPLM